MRILSIVVSATLICAAPHAYAQGTKWSAGGAVGSLKFSSGASETAIGASVAARLMDWLDVGINPTYAWTQSVAVQVSPSVTIPARSVNGFTDLPLTVGVSHALPGAWSPSFGFTFGATLPTGDTAGLGSGKFALGASVSLGIAPTEDQWLSIGAGRSLSNGYSAALASSTSTSLSLSAGTRAGQLQLSASLSGDVGTLPPGAERSSSLAAGLAVPLGSAVSFSVDAGLGFAKGSPTWALTAGVGTSAAGVVAAASSPFQRLGKAFGTGSNSKIKSKGK
jgi:hypothetical protein